MRKSYASQESVTRTLTNAELAAPFRESEPDAEPLPAVTRESVIVSDGKAAVVALVERSDGKRRLVIMEKVPA
ncbi:MAG: hypothetical protein AB7S70_02595 [Hyphomicrobium sp.]|uniref:hypothetical protein n=1 Tax=Hyphomicrobium sp. TaxID=82 RepID=UPI003D0D0037